MLRYRAGLSVLLNSLFGVWNGWNMTLCSMYFNDVNFALGLMFAAFRGVSSAHSGYAPKVFHYRVVHPYYLVPRFPLLRFPPLSSGAMFSTPAFSAPPYRPTKTRKPCCREEKSWNAAVNFDTQCLVGAIGSLISIECYIHAGSSL